MIISKISERKVKGRKRIGGKDTRKENLGERRKGRRRRRRGYKTFEAVKCHRSQSGARNHNHIRLHDPCTIVGRKEE